MSDATSRRQPESGRYEIRTRGHLDPRWAAWFDGLSLTRESDGTTVIHGPVPDQAALYAVLLKLRDLGLPLVSVAQVGSERPAMPPRPPPGLDSSSVQQRRTPCPPPS
jgi:hypothetical protein